MITIECNEPNHVKALFHKLKDACRGKLEVTKGQHHLHIRVHNEELPQLAGALAEYVIATEEESWILQLVEQKFYFKDINEQEQILVVAKSILDGEKTDLPKLTEVRPRKEVIAEAFSKFITADISFCYESFLQFRLKDYHDCLLQYVEMAIDEYKLEQEYQTFVENLRALVNRRPPVMDTVQVVHNKDFVLCDEHDHVLDNRKYFEDIDPMIKVRIGLDVEPSVLVTLIAIAPRRIFLYSDRIDTGMIQTIQNVFQERVVLYPRRMFENTSKSLYLAIKENAVRNSLDFF